MCIRSGGEKTEVGGQRPEASLREDEKVRRLGEDEKVRRLEGENVGTLKN